MRESHKSCQKYLIREHFERLLKSHIMHVGGQKPETFFIFNWSRESICAHRLMRPGCTWGYSYTNKIHHLSL